MFWAYELFASVVQMQHQLMFRIAHDHVPMEVANFNHRLFPPA